MKSLTFILGIGSVFVAGLVSSVSGKPEGECTFTDWEFDAKAPKCPRGTREIYSDSRWGQTSRHCCTKGSEAEDRANGYARDCRSTDCESSTTPDLCGTMAKRKVKGEEIDYEEILRDVCFSERTSSQGLVGLCCERNSTDGALMTKFGAERNEFPHIAHLSVGCGSTIYNKRWLLTASHCIVGNEDHQVVDPATVTAVVGSSIGDLSTKDHVYQVDKIIPHFNYSRLKGNPEAAKGRDADIFNDVALLHLDRDIVFSDNVKALEIAPKGFVADKYAPNVVIAGWGKTDNMKGTKHLQKANLIIRSDEKCGKTWGGSMPSLKDQLLCVGGIVDGEYSPIAGEGDSGGPAICRGRNGHPILCGITSFGGSDEKCAQFTDEKSCIPSVYAEVAYFSDYIKKHAGEQDKSTFMRTYLYGQQLRQGQYDHQVHITSTSGKSCGGTLITKDLVVTAAQCVQKDNGKLHEGLKVTTGLQGLTEKGKTFRVKGAKALDGFKREGPNVGAGNLIMADNYFKNDLALVKLDGQADVDNSKLPKLPSFGDKPSAIAYEVSFPRNSTKSKTDKLLRRDYRTLDHGECQTRMNRIRTSGAKITVDENLICGVEKYSGGSQCDRELGGGLICRGENGEDILCGVQNFRLCMYSIPNGFINVGLFRKWIDSTGEAL